MPSDQQDANPVNILQGLQQQLRELAERETQEMAALQQELAQLVARLEALESSSRAPKGWTLPRVRLPARGSRKARLAAGLLLGVGLAMLFTQGLRRRMVAPRLVPVAAQPLTLTLVADEPSWLEVQHLDGRGVYAGELQGRLQFPLNGGLKVLAGRPDLVRVQVGNQPERVLGRVDRVDWETFNAAGSP